MTKLIGIGALLGGVSVLASLVIGREVLIIFYQPEYAEHTDVFVWLMVAASMGYVSSILGYGMTAARHLGSRYH